MPPQDLVQNWCLTPLGATAILDDVTQTDYLTVAQASKVLGVSRWTVVRAIKDGRLAGNKLGENTAGWLLRRDEVEAYKAAAS